MGYGSVGSYRSPAPLPAEIPHAPVQSPGRTLPQDIHDISSKVCTHIGVMKEKINFEK